MADKRLTRRRIWLAAAATLCLLVPTALWFHAQTRDSPTPWGQPTTTPADTTGTVPVPEIEWPHGEPVIPEGEEGRAVETLLAYTTRFAAAFNERDFSDPKLTELATTEVILEDGAVTAGYAQQWMMGPYPGQVIDIESASDGYTIQYCTMTDSISSEIPRWWYDKAMSGYPSYYSLTKEGEGYRVTSVRSGDYGDCTMHNPRFGQFNPLPDFSDSSLYNPIGPDGRPFF